MKYQSLNIKLSYNYEQRSFIIYEEKEVINIIVLSLC